VKALPTLGVGTSKDLRKLVLLGRSPKLLDSLKRFLSVNVLDNLISLRRTLCASIESDSNFLSFKSFPSATCSKFDPNNPLKSPFIESIFLSLFIMTTPSVAVSNLKFVLRR